MKKLASLVTLCSIGLFAIGCNEVDTAGGPEPIPGDTPAIEGGSGDAGYSLEEGNTDVPPTTEETPPAITDPAPSDTDPAAGTLEESAEGTPSAVEAAESTGEAEPIEP